MRGISAVISIPHDLGDEEAFRRFIAVWQELAPGLLPIRASWTEPVRQRFDVDDLGPSIEAWLKGGWLATRTNPRLDVDVSSGGRASNSRLRLDLSVKPDGLRQLQPLRQLIARLAEDWEADWAMVHPMTNAETNEALGQRRPDILDIDRRSGTVHLTGGMTVEAKNGIPTLYWWNWFGPRYEAILGAETLLGAAWAKVERRPGGIAAFVTIEPPDDATWPAYRAAREQIMDQLGRDAFWPRATRAPDLRPHGAPPLPPPPPPPAVQPPIRDDALSDLATMFGHFPERPTPGVELLDRSRLDFDLRSLAHVDDYLEAIRKRRLSDDERLLIVLRAGAYVGEVIRRHAFDREFHWVDYEGAVAIDPSVATYGPKSVELSAVLWDGRQGLVFPLAKVAKFLEHGRGEATAHFGTFIAAGLPVGMNLGGT